MLIIQLNDKVGKSSILSDDHGGIVEVNFPFIYFLLCHLPIFVDFVFSFFFTCTRQFQAALLTQHPLEMIVHGEHTFQQDRQRAPKGDDNQHHAPIPASVDISTFRDDHVHIDEDESQQAVVEQPARHKEHLVHFILLDSGADAALGAPGDIVNIAEAVDHHCLRIGSSVA